MYQDEKIRGQNIRGQKQTLSEILRVVLSTCCKHALEAIAPNANISVAIPWNLQHIS